MCVVCCGVLFVYVALCASRFLYKHNWGVPLCICVIVIVAAVAVVVLVLHCLVGM